MRTPAAPWIAARDAETVVGVIQTVALYNIAGVGIPITQYLHKQGISLVTKRIEQGLSEFQPASVSLVLDNNDTFFDSGGTGIFDAVNISQGYQIIIHIGIDGVDFINPAIPNCFIFDGKLYVDSVKKEGLEKIQVTVHGWLKDAETYNAEEIADPNNPPFKYISGLAFVSATGHTGAKQMVYGIEDSIKYLEYEGGEREYLYSPGVPGSPLELWDSVKENSITVNYTIGAMPTEGQTDYFTIINLAGVKHACYWYENIKLEDIVSHVYDHIGVTNQDIDVREIETGITDKHFIYFTPFFTDTVTSDMKITAIKVVKYLDPNITLLIGIEEEKGVNNSIYRIIMNTSTWTYTSVKLFATIYRVAKFVYANARTWVILAEAIDFDGVFAGLGERWVAKQLRELKVDWSGFDDVDNFINDMPAPNPGADTIWDIAFANTCSALNHSTKIYFIRQYRVGPTAYQMSLESYDCVANVFAVEEPVLRLTPGGSWDLISEDYGTVAWQGAGPNEVYYWAANQFGSIPHMWLARYNITTNTDEMRLEPTLPMYDNIDTKVLDMRWERVGAVEYAHIKLHAREPAFGQWRYQDWWFLKDAVPPHEVLYDALSDTWHGRYFDTNHPVKNQYLTSWFVDSSKGNQWFIKRYNGRDPSDYAVESSEALIPEYEGIITAPMIYKDVAGEFHYCGCLIDTGSYQIVPYIYTSGALATVRIADFTGYSCRDALKYLAEAYLDYHDIHERDSGRFYYRETNLGAGTLDENICIKDRDGYSKTKIEYWENWCDGVIVENSRRDLRYKLGNTSFGARVIHIDNRFLSEQTCKFVAEWYWEFFKMRRRLITVEVKMFIEPELMDKITLTLRKRDGTVYEVIDCLIYEISVYPSPDAANSFNVTLKLLEIDGVVIHETRLVQLPSHKIRIP